MRGLKLQAFVTAALILAGVGTPRAGEMLEHVKSAAELTCGVVTEEYDCTKDDTHGNLAALGIDFCKAVAAAVLGEGGKLQVSSFPDEHHGLQAVGSGKIALLAGTTPSATSAALHGVGFAQPIFFDGQGFIAHTDERGDQFNWRSCRQAGLFHRQHRSGNLSRRGAPSTRHQVHALSV